MPITKEVIQGHNIVEQWQVSAKGARHETRMFQEIYITCVILNRRALNPNTELVPLADRTLKKARFVSRHFGSSLPHRCDTMSVSRNEDRFYHRYV